MKKAVLRYIIFFGLFLFTLSGAYSKSKFRVLVFSLTKGYHHKSIANGIVALQKMGAEKGFSVDTTTNPALFTSKQLKKYKVIVFLSPTGNDLFNEEQKSAFQKYIHKGGGLVGIHAATDCLYNWPWYGKLIGAYFLKHPKQQKAVLTITDSTHISTRGLKSPWVHTDEWYNFKDVNPDIHTLITLDEKTYKGGTMGDFHPASWYHEFEGGRIFYTVLGHREENYTDEAFLKHIWGGIQYAAGKN